MVFSVLPGPGMWGGGGNLVGQSVDNGTASWGQTSDAPSGWGDPDNSSKAAGWGNPSSKSGKTLKGVFIVRQMCCWVVTP